MPDETVSKTDKNGKPGVMRKQVQKKPDGRTIIFYSFAAPDSADCEAMTVTELNTSKLEP
jgi:hypothetical protein